MNRLDELKRDLVSEADLHRHALRLERSLIAIRARIFREELQTNPLCLIARGLTASKPTRAPSQPELWIRIAGDVLKLVCDLRRS